jgi:hypothetical protein
MERRLRTGILIFILSGNKTINAIFYSFLCPCLFPSFCSLMGKQAGKQTDSERRQTDKKTDRRIDCQYDMKKVQVYSQRLEFK